MDAFDAWAADEVLVAFQGVTLPPITLRGNEDGRKAIVVPPSFSVQVERLQEPSSVLVLL